MNLYTHAHTQTHTHTLAYSGRERHCNESTIPPRYRGLLMKGKFRGGVIKYAATSYILTQR